MKGRHIHFPIPAIFSYIYTQISQYESFWFVNLVLLSFSSLFSQIPSYVPTNGLVGWWPFNGNANDESGNGNNGTVNGATLTSDRFGNVGKAYSFNGISDFIDLRSSVLGITGNSDRTISCWINTSAQNVQTVFASGLGVSGNPCSNNGKTYNLRLVNSKLGVMTYNCGNCSSCDLYPQSGSNLTDNNWHNVTVFMKSDTAYTYVDGFFENTQFMPNTNTTADSNFIGKDNHIGYLDYFDGKIDDLAIWNRALTPQEITNLYNAGPFDVSATNTTICAGQPTTLSVQSVSGTITALNCASATNTGTLTAGTAASGVSSSIPYTGGNGGTHNGQTVTSSGVTGLTATLIAGTFASGIGSLTYTISGTPSASGTASFALNIGGQSCSVTVSVQSALVAQYPANSVFCASGPTEVVDVVNPLTGKTWMDRNLGATRVATSSSDASSYGDLYQWGRGNDGHQCRNSDTSNIISSNDFPGHGEFIVTFHPEYNWQNPVNSNLWQGVNGVNNPCPTGYRIPTESEWENERLSWFSSNSAGAYATSLKLSSAGIRDYTNWAPVMDIGNSGHYWSSTYGNYLAGNNLPLVSFLCFIDFSAAIDARVSSYGCSVRCIKD